MCNLALFIPAILGLFYSCWISIRIPNAYTGTNLGADLLQIQCEYGSETLVLQSTVPVS
jgi:hypothetical protein